MIARRSLALSLAILGALVAVSLAARDAHAGGGGCHEPLTDARGTAVDLKGNCLLPAVLRVDEGATVVFTNRDAVPHTVTGVGLRSASPSAWGSFDELQQGESATYAFASSGVFPYYCVLHPGMVGAVVVGDGNPSTAATDASAAEGFVSAAPRAESAATAMPQASLSGGDGDGLTTRLALFAAAILIVAATISLIVRRGSSERSSERP